MIRPVEVWDCRFNKSVLLGFFWSGARQKIPPSTSFPPKKEREISPKNHVRSIIPSERDFIARVILLPMADMVFPHYYYFVLFAHTAGGADKLV